MATTELTPMQRQYQQMKARNKDCILFFRLGDFYEMFNEDAKLAARELDLTLTSRDRSKPKEEQTPMCGVPYHSVDSYIARLVQKGYKVAICEQMEDPATAKGLVERDITRIITPGTVTESCMLEESKNNFMGCICAQGGRYGLAFCDLSTGAFFSTTCVDQRSVCSELGRFSPSEVLRFGAGAQEEEISDVLFRRLNCCVDEGTAEDFELTQCEELLHKHFGKSVQDLGMGSFPGAIRASGALLKTLLTLQKNDLAHIRELQYYTNGRFMELDLDARRNLELTETMRSKEKRGTLLWILDKTHTAMGGRMLRSWLEKPLLDPAEITRRQQAVEALVEDPILRGELPNTFHMNEVFSGAIMAADNVLALFLLPLFGALSDKCRSPLGRRRPFILFGSLAAIVLMMALPVLNDSYRAAPSAGKMVAFVVVLGALLVAMGTYRAPAVALMPDVTPKPLRSKANAVINLMGAVGGIIYLLLTTFLYTDKSADASYLPLFAIVAGIMLLALIVLMTLVNEPKLVARQRDYEKQHPEEDLAVETPAGEKLPAAVKKSLGSCSAPLPCGSWPITV